MTSDLHYPVLAVEGGGGDQGASFGPNYSSEIKPASSLGPTGEYFSRSPSLLRRLTLCKLSLCETFKTASDDAGIWGECQKCGKRVGCVCRAELREIGRREYEAEMHRRAAR